MMTAKTKLILKNCTRLVSFILILLLLLYGISFLLGRRTMMTQPGS